MNNQIYKKNVVESCYGHLSGILGEALFKFLLKQKWIENSDGEYNITDKGYKVHPGKHFVYDNLDIKKEQVINRIICCSGECGNGKNCHQFKY